MTSSIEFGLTSLSLSRSRWWQCLRPDPDAAIRLWCFPCLGAGAAMWHPWATRLAGAAELVSICLPGREARLAEAPLTRMSELADTLAAVIAPQADERDVFCGHGVGGLLAFEVARRLRRQWTGGPRGLVVGGVRAPHHRMDPAATHRLSPREFLSTVEARYGAIPAEIRNQPEFLELLLPALRADLEIEETYRYVPGELLETPLLALAATGDPLVTRDKMAGWRYYTTGRFEFEPIIGGHFFAIENAAGTADRVRAFLATL